MKRFNILQFFSKKGVLVLGLVAGMMLSFFCCQGVSAFAFDSELNISAPEGYRHFWSYSYVGQVYEQFCESVLFESGQIAVYELDGYYYPIASQDASWCGTLNGSLGYVNGEGPYSVVKQGMTGCVFFVPVFGSLAECKSYFQTGDFSSALNYDDLSKNEEQVSGIDDSLPYFDSSVMQLNQNDSVTYHSSMSANMQSEFYQMCAKVADKYGTAEESERYKAYVEMSASALYANNEALGVFNSAALKLAGTTAPGGTAKLDEVIQFDTNGKIKVSAYSNSNSAIVGALGGSMGGQSVVKTMFNINSSSPLVAVAVDDITLNDKNSSFPGVVRNLSASSTISESSSIWQNVIMGGVATSGTTYTLVGYVADVRIIYYEVSTGKYIASRDTYTYTWTYTTLQNRYGSGTVSYDSSGNIVSKNEFDNLNADVGGNWGTVPDYDTDSFTKHIQNGFGLLGKNGFFVLCKQTFSFLPFEIWILIFMAVSVSIIIMVLKVVRGM